MKNLVGRLIDQPASSLRRVAEFWDVRISQSATHEDVFYLCREMLDERSGRRLLEKLNPDDSAVLRYLLGRNNFWAYTTDVASATAMDEEKLGRVFSRLQDVALAFLEDVCIKGGRMVFCQPSGGDPFESPEGRRRMISVPRELGRMLQKLAEEMQSPLSPDAGNASLLLHYELPQLERIARNWGIPSSLDPSSKDELVALLSQVTADPSEITQTIRSLERGGLAIYRAVRQAGGKMLLADLRSRCKADEDTIRRLLRALADRFVVLETYRNGERLLFVPAQIRDAKSQLRQPAPHLAPSPPPAKVSAVAPYALPQDLLAFLSFIAQGEASVTATTHQLPKRLAKRLAGSLAITDEEILIPYLQFLQHLSAKLGLVVNARLQLSLTPAIERWISLDFNCQIRQLYKLWLSDRWWHEPLEFEELWTGNWTAARLKVVEWLRTCEPQEWYHIESLVEATRSSDPFFMRSKQDIVRFHGYRGLENIREEWDDHEGKVLRGLLKSALYWLGMVELGSENGEHDDSFRITEIAKQLLADKWDPEQAHHQPATLIAQPNFEVMVFHPSPRLVWSLLQFTDAVRRDRVNVYAINKESVLRGLDRGLSIDDMLETLSQHSQKDIPQNIAYTFHDWGRQSKEVSLHKALLVETEDGAVLDELLSSKVLEPYSVRRLSRTAVSIIVADNGFKSKEDELAVLMRDLRKLGYRVKNCNR